MPRWATRALPEAEPSGLGQREPEVLAAAVGAGERAPGQRGDEVLGALEVPADGAGVVDLDGGDRAAGDPLLESAPDHLDLGKLGHAGQLSVSVRQAASAASCSAAFFVRPLPRPYTVPAKTTAAVKVFAWSGPSSSTW